jgi:hypothetical protein
MNNQDNPRRLRAEANWTNYIDGKSDPDHESDAESRIGKMTHCDLTQGHMDDLEIDSMLRELARSELQEQEFVGKVLGKLDLPNPNPVPRKKGTLPVPAPVFETEFPEDVSQGSAGLISRVLESPWVSPKSLLVASSLAAALAITFFIYGLDPDSNSGHFANNDKPYEFPSVVDGGSDLATNASDEEEDNGHSESLADSTNSWNKHWILNPAFASDGKTGSMIADNSAGGSSDVGPGLRPIKRWKFALDFDKFGMGKMNVNGIALSGVAFRDSSLPLLNNLGVAVKSRFESVQTRLNTTIGGTISVNGKDFRFGSPDRIDLAIAKAIEHMSTLPVEPMTEELLMERRKQHLREQEFKSFMAAGTDQPVRPQFDLLKSFRKVTTSDEAVTINTVVEATESFLRDWSKEMVEWQLAAGIESPKTDQDVLSDADFEAFLTEDAMLVIKEAPTVRATKTLQKLNADELKSQLASNTRALDIFKSSNEFKQAAESIRKHDHQGVSRKSEAFSKQLAGIVTQLETFAKKENLNEEERVEVAGLETQYVKVAEQLDRFREKNGVEPLLDFLEERPELKGLPLVMGDECHMDAPQALSMSRVSKSVGATLLRFDRFATRDARQDDSFRFNMVRLSMVQQSRNYTDDNALVTLDQMLQIDHPRVRIEMVDALSKSQSEKGIELLARRAKFDLLPEVRLASTQALANLDPKDYRGYLLEGFDYPWPAVAQHSAEALVRLEDHGALDDLVSLLRKPAPNLPAKTSDGTFVRREVVAINHMKNCLLCHAPSTGMTDRGRAVVPRWNEPLPRLYYNQPNGGSFVRADTTYLRQDFSVMQEVEEDGPWPKIQRFDYVTYLNEMTNEEARDYFQQHRDDENLHRQAVVFALRELTGMNPPDDSHATWVAAVAKFKKSLPKP